jgi:hypothetical protein
MKPARPTLRCLRDDLELALPPLTSPLEEIEHPLLVKASERFAHESTAHERIRAIDGEVLFKVKVQRWRGAVWVEIDLPWLVAGGRREVGSPDDFYTALANDARSARATYNARHRPPIANETFVGHLLPSDDDRLRYQLEAGVRLVRHLERVIPDLVRDSLRDGHEHSVDLGTFGLGVQVRADHGHETYVAIRIVGRVRDDLTMVILDIVPGCDPAGWYPEAALPERQLRANEQAWSNLMDTQAAAKLLESD